MSSDPWPSVGRSYDAVAEAYEARFGDELAAKPRDRDLLAAFAATLPHGGVILDVGCGPGQIGAAVRVGTHPVVGVDLSAAMAQLAAARLDAALAADALRLPVADGRAAGVVAFYSLIHLRRGDLVIAVRELARVLVPGGKVLASFHEGEGEVRIGQFLGADVPLAATLFDLEELFTTFEDGGLRVDVTERRPPYADEGDTVRLYVGATASR